MTRDELAETIFEAMNNQRIERTYAGWDWENLPGSHQQKYLETADLVRGFVRLNPEMPMFEGVE